MKSSILENWIFHLFTNLTDELYMDRSYQDDMKIPDSYLFIQAGIQIHSMGIINTIWAGRWTHTIRFSWINR